MSENESGTDAQPLQAHQSTSGSAARTPPEVRERKGRKAAPRLYHKKSRTGCQRCRARRVKCDEVHPVCGSCQRYQLPCGYDRSTSKTSPKEIHKSTRLDRIPPVYDSSTDSLEYPESKKRRLLELRLIHQYTTETSRTLELTSLGSAEPNTGPWTSDLPNLAFRNDALLNVMCAIAALHTTKRNPQDSEAVDVYRNYLDLALREHFNDVTQITKINADAACMTSSLIRIAAFAVLQERPLVPYAPPTQWLQMTRGAGNVFREAWDFIEDDNNSIAFRMVQRTPIVKDSEALFEKSSRQGLLHLLHGTPTEHALEAWSAEVEEAYASTLSYIGSVQSLIAGGEKPGTVCRILIMFPYLIQKGFIDLVEEQRPRALVILAHYFALLARFEYIWFIGDIGSREIRAIQAALPEEWQELMTYPLQTLAEGIMIRKYSALQSWSQSRRLYHQLRPCHQLKLSAVRRGTCYRHSGNGMVCKETAQRQKGLAASYEKGNTGVVCNYRSDITTIRNLRKFVALSLCT